jgi:putative heme iron utilization protein
MKERPAELPDPEKLRHQARAMRDAFRSVLLSSLSPQGRPEISYAPFVLDDEEAICIYVSELATHTRNLRVNPVASLMFIQDEGEVHNLFARERLVLHCNAEEVMGDAVPRLLERMEQELGKTVALLRSLPDFHLFRFSVETGSYIRGLGQAWPVLGNDLTMGELNGS